MKKKSKLFKRTKTKDMGAYIYDHEISLSNHDEALIKASVEKHKYGFTTKSMKYYYYKHLNYRLEAEKLTKKLPFALKKDKQKERTYRKSECEIGMLRIERIFNDLGYTELAGSLGEGNYPKALDFIGVFKKEFENGKNNEQTLENRKERTREERSVSHDV